MIILLIPIVLLIISIICLILFVKENKKPIEIQNQVIKKLYISFAIITFIIAFIGCGCIYKYKYVNIDLENVDPDIFSGPLQVPNRTVFNPSNKKGMFGNIPSKNL